MFFHQQSSLLRQYMIILIIKEGKIGFMLLYCVFSFCSPPFYLPSYFGYQVLATFFWISMSFSSFLPSNIFSPLGFQSFDLKTWVGLGEREARGGVH